MFERREYKYIRGLSNLNSVVSTSSLTLREEFKQKVQNQHKTPLLLLAPEEFRDKLKFTLVT